MKKLIMFIMLLPLMVMANYSIGDKVWYDKNQNWVQDTNEPGYPHVKVNLLDENGKKIRSTFTNEKGYYKFKNIPIGEYRVNVTPPEGTTIITESPIELWLSENRHDINFGIFKPIVYSITGIVWNDQNKDWKMEEDEPKASNVTVELFNGNGEKLATTKTNEKGHYKFSKLEIGEYRVKVINSDGISIITESPIELWLSENRHNINFGIFKPITYSISGTIWNDKNTDWEMGVSEPKVANVTVELLDGANNKIASTKTNGHGIYLFPNQSVGEYKVKVLTTDTLSTVTESPLELWLAENRDMLDFGILTSDVSTSFVTREQLIAMIKDGENVTKVNTSEITDMHDLLKGNTTFNQDIRGWDVSNVTNMKSMFTGLQFFNQNINHWDVSKVTNMSGMFSSNTNFNQALDKWDVSRVTDMNGMFSYNSNFNQPLDNWDVSKVTNMGAMFFNAYKFNQSLNNWDVSKVTNMNGMFLGSNFNQPLDNWNVSKVTNMISMFSYAKKFNQSLNSWDVSNVDYMNDMFFASENFNKPLNNWDVSKVSYFSSMFLGAKNFNQPLNNWDVSNAKYMIGMFNEATSFNQNINSWDVSAVTHMSSMFHGAKNFNQPLNNWDTSTLTNMNSMFQKASKFNQNISNWNVSNVTQHSQAFDLCPIQEDYKPTFQ